MQNPAKTNAEMKCICATTHNNKHIYSNKINIKKCNNNNNNYNSQFTTRETIVCNMAAATIPAMTDDADSGCCKLRTCNSFSDNIQRCGKNVDYITTTKTTTATITTPSAVASSKQRSTTLTHCCMKDDNSQLRLTKRSTTNNNKKCKYQQHTCAVGCKEGNFMASESATKMQDCKHSVVSRNNSDRSTNLQAPAKPSRATDTTKTTTMRSSFSIDSSKRVLAMMMLLFCFAWQDFAQATLSNVNLFIEPPAVRRGQSVILRCQYALEGAPLYSIKYYRGNYEFYRYTPGEFPNVKHFQYPGIKVDEVISNATQVVIRDVKFSLSGNFSCEVTADAPLFSTATAYAQVQVVEFPEKRPQLFTEHARYEPGDILRANCSTPPSRPRADLHFTLNNIPVSTGETQYIRTVDNLIASRLSLKLQLHAAHFAAAINTQHLMNHLGGSQSAVGVSYNTHGGGGGLGVVGNGGLVLRCTAQIGDLYQEYKEIELGTPQKDPVPARVTLSSGSSLSNFFEYFSSASSSAASANILKTTTSTRRTTSTTFIAHTPLKLTILAAAVWRTQALFLDVAVGVVDGVYNALRLKQAIMRNNNNNNGR